MGRRDAQTLIDMPGGVSEGLAPIWLLRTLVLVFGLTTWQLAAAYLVDPMWVGKPSEIALRLIELARSGALLRHASSTLGIALSGLGLSLLVGVPTGILFAANITASKTLEPYLLGFYSLPRISLAPLFILWFGIGDFSKIMMTFSMVVFVVILNTYEGLRSTDPEMIEMLQVMRASPLYILRKVKLPSILPWIFAATRVGIGLGLVGAVVGELLGANRGLGWYLEFTAGRLDITGVFAALLVLMAIGMGLNEMVTFIEVKFWRSRIS